MAGEPTTAAIIRDAQARLEWLLDDYGEDDVDYVTFAPAVALGQVIGVTWIEDCVPADEADPADDDRAFGDS